MPDGNRGDRAAGALDWLEANSGPWAKASGPAAYAELILAAEAAGADVHHFGGQDLVAQLNATGPKPASVSASTTPVDSTKADKKDDKGGSPFGVWWIVGVCLVAGVGVGFLLSVRNKR